MYMVIKSLLSLFVFSILNFLFIFNAKAYDCSTKIEGNTLPNSGEITKHSCNISAYDAFIKNNPYKNNIDSCYSNFKISNFILNDCKKPISKHKDFFKLIKSSNLLEREQRCSTTITESGIIYDNCVLDKSEGTAKHLRNTIKRVCRRISCNPSFFESLKYK